MVDDVGNNLARAQRLIDMPFELTLGLLPFSPYAPSIAVQARLAGKEIILHQPMEPIPANHAHTERGTLKLAMSAENFDRQFADSLARLPHVVGVNNHTGSLLTAHREPMDRLMSSIRARGLFFLDSRTTADSVAETAARDWQVPTIHRDVFLDHVITPAAIENAFSRALAIARRRGHAVVIAHPHRLSLDFLETKLAALPEDIRLTTLGKILQTKRLPNRTTLALRENRASPSISLGQ